MFQESFLYGRCFPSVASFLFKSVDYLTAIFMSEYGTWGPQLSECLPFEFVIFLLLL